MQVTSEVYAKIERASYDPLNYMYAMGEEEEDRPLSPPYVLLAVACLPGMRMTRQRHSPRAIIICRGYFVRAVRLFALMSETPFDGNLPQ